MKTHGQNQPIINFRILYWSTFNLQSTPIQLYIERQILYLSNAHVSSRSLTNLIHGSQVRDCFRRRIRLPKPTGSVAVYGYITQTGYICGYIVRSPYTATEPIHCEMVRPGGVLSGKVGTGMCGPDRVLFRALRFCNGPFFI